LRINSNTMDWPSLFRGAINTTSDVAVEACLPERLNVAWAYHEFTAQYADDMLDFCEETGRYARNDTNASDIDTNMIKT